MEYKCDGKQKVVGKTQIEKNHKIHKDRNRLYISRKQTNRIGLSVFLNGYNGLRRHVFRGCCV